MAKPISALDLFRAGNDTMQIAARLSVSEEEALEQVPASAALLFVFRLLTRSIPTPSPPAGRKGRSHTRGGISSFRDRLSLYGMNIARSEKDGIHDVKGSDSRSPEHTGENCNEYRSC